MCLPVPGTCLLAAYCYCCCTYSYSLLEECFTDLVHKSVRLAVSTAQLVPRCVIKDHPLPLRGHRCSIAVPALQDELDGSWKRRTVGVASASQDGCRAACLLIVLNRCGRITPTIRIDFTQCSIIDFFE